ncbi:hypothetical protein CMK11_04095 [Candidatus Poribacteria bacterium]|nr:hypothetical protein [Candidatus Poribacteria bacterium]
MSTEAQLVRDALDGDKGAFGLLAARHRQRVHAVARSVLGDPAEAHDAAQDAFLIAYERLSSLRDHHRFASWLCSIARHVCHRRIRGGEGNIVVSLEAIVDATGEARGGALATDAGEDPAAQAERASLLDRIDEAVSSLPETYREVAALLIAGDTSYREMAASLELPMSTVQSRIQRARTLLAEGVRAMSKEWFDAYTLPADFEREALTETDVIRATDMRLDGPRWGVNGLSLHLVNKSHTVRVVIMDVRTEVREDRGMNWQTQFQYELDPGTERTVRESFNITRILRDFGYVSRDGRIALRLSLSLAPPDAGGPNRAQPFFQKEYLLRALPEQLTRTPGPDLPEPGEVTVQSLDLGTPAVGANVATATLVNHTGEAKSLYLHIDVDGGGYGGGACHTIYGKGRQEIRQNYRINPHEQDPVTARVWLAVLPHNIDALGWEDSLGVWAGYALDHPDAIIHQEVASIGV